MGLTSALFTGLTGLDVNQTKLNVVGNNIANVNTTGFKSSRALFSSQYYQTDAAASPPDTNFGGTDPSQEGLGAQMQTIQKNMTQGTLQTTGVPTDMAIDGGGFFIVQGQSQEYTRDGSFLLNSSNELVNSSGDFVQGYGVDSDGHVQPGKLQNITIPLGQTTMAKATENVDLSGNLKANGDTATGASIINSQALTTKTSPSAGTAGATPTSGTFLVDLTNAPASGAPSATSAFAAGDVLTVGGKVGDRDLSTQTFTVTATSTLGDLQNFMNEHMGINTDPNIPSGSGVPAAGASVQSISGDPAGSARLVIAGNTGTKNALSLAGSSMTNQNGVDPLTFDDDGTDAARDKSGAVGESVHTSFVAYDSLGNTVNVDVTAVLESKNAAGTTWRFYANSADNSDVNAPPSATNPGSVLGDGTLTFDQNGSLTASTGATISVDRTGSGAPPVTMKLDFSGTTSLGSTGNSTLVMTQQDGEATGALTSYSIGEDGTITGSYTNGLSKSLGQIAIATFNNSTGLDDQGGNLYKASANSGVAVVTSPNTLGAGKVKSGTLEQSNVDLSTEFTNLIIASTGFSAASKVITTSDQLITDLLNSTR